MRYTFKYVCNIKNKQRTTISLAVKKASPVRKLLNIYTCEKMWVEFSAYEIYKIITINWIIFFVGGYKLENVIKTHENIQVHLQHINKIFTANT